MKDSYRLIIISFLCLFLLSACLSPVKLPQKTLYTLNPIVRVPHCRHSYNNLLVLSTQAPDDLDTTRMAYVTKANQLAYFSQHAWAARPAGLIHRWIVTALRQSDCFNAVVDSPFIGVTDLKLATQLIQLQQNFLPHQHTEQIQLATQMIDAKTGKILAEKTFTAQVNTLHNTPYGGVAAANRALQQILPNLTQFAAKFRQR